MFVKLICMKVGTESILQQIREGSWTVSPGDFAAVLWLIELNIINYKEAAAILYVLSTGVSAAIL